MIFAEAGATPARVRCRLAASAPHLDLHCLAPAAKGYAAGQGATHRFVLGKREKPAGQGGKQREVRGS